MAFLLSQWRVLVLVGACLAGLGLYALGKHDGRQQALSDQLRDAVKAEKERGRDDEKLRDLTDYDFCTLALRRRGLPVEQCDELRGVAAE